MSERDTLRFAVKDLFDGEEVSPALLPFAMLAEFQKDVSDFLRGSYKDVELHRVTVSVETDPLCFVVHGLAGASNLWTDLSYLADPSALHLIDPRRAQILERWQATAQSGARMYQIGDANQTLVAIDAASRFERTDDPWAHVEKYLYGRITDAGGKTRANIHVELDSGRTLTVAASQELLEQQEQNLLYKPAMLRVTAEESLLTGELREVRLLGFQTYMPKFDLDAFERMVERGTRAWADVDDPAAWVEELRGRHE